MRSKYFIALALILVELALPNFIWAEDPDHPRLLLTNSVAQDIWSRIISSDPALDPADSMWAKLQTEAEYSISGSDPNLFSTFYQYREIEKLALVSLLLRQSTSPDSIQLGEAFIDSAIALCEREIIADTTLDNAWNKFKAIHRVKALTLTYDYGYSRLTETQKTEFEDSILRNLFKGAPGQQSVYYQFIRSEHAHQNNHGAFWATAVLYGAIALKGEVDTTNNEFSYRFCPPDSAQDKIELVKGWMFTNQDNYLKRMFGQDGACVEGLNYGFCNLMLTFEALQAFSAWEDTTWFDHPDHPHIKNRLSKFDDWITYEMLPDPESYTSPNYGWPKVSMNMLNDTWNWGDGWDPGEPIFRMLGLAGLYNQDLGVWAFQKTRVLIKYLNNPYTTGTESSDLLTAADWIVALANYEQMSAGDPEQLSKSAYFRDRGLIYWRTGWQSDDIQFAFECAPALNKNIVPGEIIYSDKHDQSDKNSFTLYAYQEPFVIDYGYPPKEAVSNEGNSTNENNYIVIDGNGEGVYQGYLTNGRIVNQISGSFASWVHGDAEDAYDKLLFGDSNDNPDSVYLEDDPILDGINWYINPVYHADRHVQFIREDESIPPYFVIADDIQKDDDTHLYEWLVQTSTQNTINTTSNPVRIYRTAYPDRYLDIYVTSPPSYSDSVEYVTNTAYFDSLGPIGGQKSVDIELRRLRIKKSNVVNPYFHMILYPHKSGLEAPSNWDTLSVTGGSVAEISWQNYADYSIFTHGDSISGDTVSTDALLSLVRKHTTQDQITRFIMSEGSQLTFQETLLVDLYGSAGTVVNSGAEVDMYGQSIVDFKVYAPEAQTTNLNDAPVSFYKSGNYVTAILDHITENTTWESNSTVIIEKNLVVDPGVTLIIEPGVVVKFAQSTNLQIDGILQAKGSPSDSIRFTAINTTKKWSRILFTNSSVDSLCILQNCLVEHANTGILCNSSSPDTIANISIRQCENGIRCENSSSPQILSPMMNDGTVAFGISCTEQSNPVINSPFLFGNGAFYTQGIHIYNSHPEIHGGTISNFARGIDICGGDPDIRDVELFNNTECGIACNWYEDQPPEGLLCASCSAYVAYNTITDNKYGIRSKNASPAIFRNKILGNDSVGVWCSGTATPNLGVDATPDSGYNEICNDLLNVYSECSGTVKAENNWWEQTPPDTNKLYGSIDYIPYLFQSPDSIPPTRITDLTSTLVDSCIALQWTAVSTDTTGKSDPVPFYFVYRDTIAGFFPEPSDSIAVETTTVYLDCGVVGDASVNYYYSVRAVDYGYNFSSASNQVGEFDKSLTEKGGDEFPWPPDE